MPQKGSHRSASVPEPALSVPPSPWNTPSPTWLPQLLAIRSANPDQPPSIYANALMAQHRIPTDGRTVKAALKAWDEHQPAA